MIDIKEIDKLASLSRIKITNEERVNFQKEIDSILAYIDQIKTATVDLFANPEAGEVKNVFREDVVKNKTGEFTDAILKNAPNRRGDYFKVKKIL